MVERLSVIIHTAEIRLDGVLKFAGLVSTGGEAKQLIQAGAVRVNGEIERHRSHLVRPGDTVEMLGPDHGVAVVLTVTDADR